jgi:hypothetical protein
VALSGAPAVMRRAAQLALRNGYQPGENIQGGAYGLSIKAIRKMNAAGLFNQPLTWLDTALGEDVLVPMLVKAVGLELHDAAGNGNPFGVRYKGLPDTPAELVSRGYAIIHSVKNDARFSEGEIREFFHWRREQSKLARLAPLPKAS